LEQKEIQFYKVWML